MDSLITPHKPSSVQHSQYRGGSSHNTSSAESPLLDPLAPELDDEPLELELLELELELPLELEPLEELEPDDDELEDDEELDEELPEELPLIAIDPSLSIPYSFNGI